LLHGTVLAPALINIAKKYTVSKDWCIEKRQTWREGREVAIESTPQWLWILLWILSYFVCYCILLHHSWSIPIPSLHCRVVLFLWILVFIQCYSVKGNSHNFFSSIKSILIQTPKQKCSNLQNYITHTPFYWRKSWWKRMTNCVKTHKGILESYFGFYVLFCLWR
jgi:hypothetical protein